MGRYYAKSSTEKAASDPIPWSVILNDTVEIAKTTDRETATTICKALTLRDMKSAADKLTELDGKLADIQGMLREIDQNNGITFLLKLSTGSNVVVNSWAGCRALKSASEEILRELRYIEEELSEMNARQTGAVAQEQEHYTGEDANPIQ